MSDLDRLKLKHPILSGIPELRRRAREHLDRGSLTPSYRGDLTNVLRLLNEALATEIVCTLRYMSHYFMAEGIQAQPIAAEFLEHANQEEEHARLLARRIKQLGGAPNFNPEGLLDRSHAEYEEGETLVEMIREDLLAERIAIESYNEMIRYLGDTDSTTRRLLELILSQEEEHADELASLLLTLDPTKKAQHQAA